MFSRFHTPIHHHIPSFKPLYTSNIRPKPNNFNHITLKSLPPLVDDLLNTPELEAPAGSTPQQMLRVTEAFWKAMKDDAPTHKPPHVVFNHSSISDNNDNDNKNDTTTATTYDVCIAGGTLGIFLGLALQQKGHSVCIIEKNILQGRNQEWNINKAELQSFVDHGLFSQQELDDCIVTEWQYNRMAFKGSDEMFISDVLNIGVSPRLLIDVAKKRFLECGGVVLEHTAFRSANVYNDCVLVHVNTTTNHISAADSTNTTTTTNNSVKQLSARLLIDCMGHFSPIVKQIRNNQRPDGMVIVVGGCMDGIAQDKNVNGDLLYSFTDSDNDIQLFWEAFPAEGGRMRTAYMFMYTDTHPERPDFASILNTYLELLPEYQDTPLSSLKFKRILLGGFPCYINSSPLAPAFNRILQIGDASAAQSPLSFGGFGSLVRHLPRLTRGINDALVYNKLQRRDLAWLQPYQPSLSVSWLFQRSMSVRVGQLARWLPSGHINRLLRCNFAVMKFFGDRVLRPFVQDAMQCIPLGLTMIGMMIRDPIAVTTVLFQTGFVPVLNWFRHFIALTVYSVMYKVLKPLRSVVKVFEFQRLLDVLEVGSASDYVYHHYESRGSGGGVNSSTSVSMGMS